MSSDNTTTTVKIPILLLKTKSSPTDAYEEYFSSRLLPANCTNANAADIGAQTLFSPHFVPVLEHRFDDDALGHVRGLLVSGAFLDESHGASREGGGREEDDEAGKRYGGLIFTSQRAVEAFTHVVEELVSSSPAEPVACRLPLLAQSTPLYTVGPATSRALRAVTPLLHVSETNVLGAETGNGEKLAHFILEHYNELHPFNAATERRALEEGKKRGKPPLLFLTGEQRRDIIPKTLDSPPGGDESQAHRRIDVEEMVVYATGTMASFETDLAQLLRTTKRDYPSASLSSETQPQELSSLAYACSWIIIFSPTGCDVLLRTLGLLDPETGRAYAEDEMKKRNRKTMIATIGPTTRDYLIRKFGFDPDVCAESPSPEGVGRGIESFMRGRWNSERG